MPGTLGVTVLSRVEEDVRFAAGVVTTRLHNMVAKIAPVSDLRSKRCNAIQMIALVSTLSIPLSGLHAKRLSFDIHLSTC